MKEAALCDIDKQIKELVDDENLQVKWETSEACYVLVCVAKSKLSRRIQENLHPQMANVPMVNGGPLSSPRGDSGAAVKLPQLEMGKFDEQFTAGAPFGTSMKQPYTKTRSCQLSTSLNTSRLPC